MERFYRKEYMPGYTGYIAQKLNTFGITVGEINRQLVQKTSDPSQSIQKRLFYSPEKPISHPEIDKLKYSFQSRKAENWICGQTNTLFPQHIPGYMGHVPHMAAENIFGKSFARCSKAAISDKINKDQDPNYLKRYLSINHKFFNEKNNRRFYEKPKEGIQVQRDVIDYYHYIGYPIDRPKTPVKIESKPPAQSLNKSYYDPRKLDEFPNYDRIHPPCIHSDYSAASAKLKNIDKHSNPDYLAINQYGKNAINYQKKEKIVIPIVGYRGFQPGIVAQNFHGKCYRDLSCQSKRMADLIHPSKC